MSYNNHDQYQVLGQNVLFKHQNLRYWSQVLWEPWSIPSTCSKCSIQASKLNILKSCLMTTMINPKYLLKMFYSSIRTEYSEVMSYNNQYQSEVFSQNVLFKHQTWIYFGHVIQQPCLLSQVFGQNVVLKHLNWIYWGRLLWQPW